MQLRDGTASERMPERPLVLHTHNIHIYAILLNKELFTLALRG